MRLHIKMKLLLSIFILLCIISCKDEGINLLSDELKQRLDESDLIITGTIVGLTSVNDSVTITPKDPNLVLAEIQGEEVLKGFEVKFITIVFAGSKDISWFDKPKFDSADHGLWILNYEEIPSIQEFAPELNTLSDVFPLLDPMDFITDEKIIADIRIYLSK